MISIDTFKIDGVEDAEIFANYLIQDLGMMFCSEEIYRTVDETGLKVWRIKYFLTENDRHNKLVENDLSDSESKRILRKLIKDAYFVCELNNASFADMLCHITQVYWLS